MFGLDNVRSTIVGVIGSLQHRQQYLPNLPRFDPWRRDKVARQSAKRRSEGRWDNCGDPNRKAAAIAHNGSLRSVIEEMKRRKERNERERARRAAKRQQTMEAA